ncbi:MAG: insulinase family protein [Acidobacteria bacterium]|nr:insulinase family protein [Acidobacteriota bacterium]
MYRKTRLFGISLFLITLLVINSFSQSGRGRPPAPPPPKPSPKTAPATTALGIPDGGKLVKQDIEGVTSRFILKNGLTLIIRERHSAPLFSASVTVKAGSVDEPDDMAGILRVVQQMVLLGTAKRPGAAIDKEVARLGGVLTSSVSYDHSSFNITAPTESYKSIVELLGDIIQHPEFKNENVKIAANLAMIESRRLRDRPEIAATENLFSAAFTANRLKRGSEISETFLSTVTREQILDFYQHYYHPANTIVTVTGDLFMLNALGQLQLRFGDYKRVKPANPAGTAEKAPARQASLSDTAVSVLTKPSPFSPNPEEPPQDKLLYANSRADIGQTIITIGYRTPLLKPDKEGLKELATMQMLAAVLGLGNSSRLHQGLREGATTREGISITSKVSAEFRLLPNAGMLIVTMYIDPDRIDRAEVELFNEIERFRRQLISDGELQRARVMLEKRYYDTVSLLELETEAIANYQAQLDDYRLLDTNLSRIRTVTAQDIQQVAAKYLTITNTSIHEYEPVNASPRTFTQEKYAELIATLVPVSGQAIKPTEIKKSPALKTFDQGAERSQFSESQNIIVASVPLPIKDYSVLRGPRSYVREDKGQPKLAVGIFFQGGRLIEDRSTSGMTELMLRTMLKSTSTRRADLIALELESYGGDIHIVNEPDLFGLTLDVLSRNAESAVKLLLDIIENPFFDKDEIARERDALLARAIEARDDPEIQANQLMWASLFPDHPYGLPRYGLAEVIKSVTDEKIEAWHGKTIRRQFPLVVIVGDTDGSALISRVFSDGLRRGELDKTIKANLPPAPGAPQDKVEQRIRKLTAQSIGFRSPGQAPGGSSDLYAYDLLVNRLGAGKLIEGLRDRQGMTASVLVRPEHRLASGAFYAQFSTLPGDEQRANDLVLAELQKVANGTITDEEFEQARNFAVGRYAIELQSHVNRAIEYAQAVISDRKASDVEAQPDLIRAVKKTDLTRIAGSLIKINQAGRGVVRASK